LHSSKNIIRIIRGRKIKWVGNVARMGLYYKCIKEFYSEKLKGEDHLEDLGVDGRTYRYRHKRNRVQKALMRLSIRTAGGLV
jgi:hypothetical protein